jgi:Tol biopolymer transport system component
VPAYNLGTGAAVLGSAAISPDGQLVVFGGSSPNSTSSGLYIHNLQTGQDQLIVQQIRDDDEFVNPSFSPDNTHIVFAAAGPTWYYPQNIYSIAVDGSGLTPLTNVSVTFNATEERAMARSLAIRSILQTVLE